MSNDQRPIKVLTVVPAFNAGDTTRGIESARALRQAAERHDREIAIDFYYPKTSSMYDDAIRAAGFPTHEIDAGFSDEMVESVMTADHRGTEFFTDAEEAGRLLDLLIEVIREAQPDMVLYGFLPPVGIAAQILGIPSACYSPFPAAKDWVTRYFLQNIPDELAVGPIGHLPERQQRGLTRVLSRLVPLTGFFRQPTTARVGKERGWKNRQANMFGMLGADAQIVNDLPAFYEGQKMPDYIHIAGPLYSKPEAADVPADIRAFYEQATGPRVFVAMGSSGEKKYLLDAIEAVSGLDCSAVILVPPHVATLEEARARLKGPAKTLLTDAFVPAPAVNAMADVAIIHGGQGTVQTAVSSGTPVVGVGMQWEQEGNIDKLVAAGSGIRIRRGDWTPEAVQAALRTVIEGPDYKAAATALQEQYQQVDGYHITGEILWKVATQG